MKLTKKVIALVMAITMISTCGLSTVFAASSGLLDDPDVDSKLDSTKTEYTITYKNPKEGSASVVLANAPGDQPTRLVEKSVAGEKLRLGTNVGKLFLVDTLTCKTEDGQEIKMDQPSYDHVGGIFTMPASNIVVTLTVKKNPNPPKGDLFSLDIKEAHNYNSYMTECFLKLNDEQERLIDPLPWGPIIYWIDAGKEAILRIVPGDGEIVTSVECTGVELTSTEENIYKFTMPDNPVDIVVNIKEVTEPEEIQPEDVDADTEGAETEDGTPIIGIEVSSKPSSADVTAIKEAMNAKLKELGLKRDNSFGSFDPIDIKVQSELGKIANAILKRPIDITIKITTPGFKPTKDNLRILHNHNGEIEVIQPKKVTTNPFKKDSYFVTFPMSKFSTVMLVAVKEEKSSGGSISSGNSSSSDDSGVRPSYGGLYAREFADFKMILTGGEIVPSKAIEEIAGTNKVYTVTYKGKVYTFNGKNIAKPAKGIIYYTAEEFMALVQGK